MFGRPSSRLPTSPPQSGSDKTSPPQVPPLPPRPPPPTFHRPRLGTTTMESLTKPSTCLPETFALDGRPTGFGFTPQPPSRTASRDTRGVRQRRYAP